MATVAAAAVEAAAAMAMRMAAAGFSRLAPPCRPPLRTHRSQPQRRSRPRRFSSHQRYRRQSPRQTSNIRVGAKSLPEKQTRRLHRIYAMRMYMNYK